MPGLMMKADHCAIMKKFFVKKKYRSQKVGLALLYSYKKYSERIGEKYMNSMHEKIKTLRGNYNFWEF